MGVARVFNWGGPNPQITCNMTSSHIFKTRYFLRDKNTLEWNIRRLWPRLVGKQNIAERERHEPKVYVFKICIELWRRGEKTNVTQTYHRRGLGAGPPAA